MLLSVRPPPIVFVKGYTPYSRFLNRLMYCLVGLKKVAGFVSKNRVPVDLYRFWDHKSGLLKIQFGDHETNLDFKRFDSNH